MQLYTPYLFKFARFKFQSVEAYFGNSSSDGKLVSGCQIKNKCSAEAKDPLFIKLNFQYVIDN